MMKEKRRMSYMDALPKTEGGSECRIFHRLLIEHIQDPPRKISARGLATEVPDWLDSDPELAEECAQLGKLFEDEPLFTEANILEMPISKVEVNLSRILSVFRTLSKKYIMTSCSSHAGSLKKIDFEIRNLPQGFCSAFLACMLYISTKYLSYGLGTSDNLDERFPSARSDLFEVLFLIVHNRRNINLLDKGANVIERILHHEFYNIKKYYKEDKYETKNAQELSNLLGSWVQFVDLLGAHYANQGEITSVNTLLTEFMFEYLELLIECPKFFSISLLKPTTNIGEKLEKSTFLQIYQIFNRKVLRIITNDSISVPNGCQFFLYSFLHFVKFIQTKEEFSSATKIGKALLIFLQNFEDSFFSLTENILIYKLLSKISKKVPDIQTSQPLIISISRHIKQAASLLKPQYFEEYSISKNYDLLTTAFRFIDRFQIFDFVFPEISVGIEGREFIAMLIAENVYSAKNWTFHKVYEIFSSKLMDYTSPTKIDLESILVEAQNHILSQAFNTIMNALLMASWENPSIAVKQILFDLENKPLTDKMIFGNGRFLLNLIDRKVVSNIEFCQWLYTASHEKMRSLEIRDSREINRTSYEALHFQELEVMKRIWDVLIGRDMEDFTREILENTFLLLASRSEITLTLLDLHSEITISLELATEALPYTFIVNLLQKCLVVFKYSVGIPEKLFQTSNIANTIIEFISNLISVPSNFQIHSQYIFALYDILLKFLSPDKASQKYSVHLNSIYSLQTWKYLLPNTKFPFETPDLLCNFLNLIEIFFTQSETIKDNIKESEVLPLMNFDSKCVSLSLQLTDIKMQKNILLKILKLAFEKEVDISKRARNNVNNPYFLFVSIKLLRSLAKKFSIWKEEALIYLSYIMQTIGSSFNNIVIISTAHWNSRRAGFLTIRVGILDELIRLFFIYLEHSEGASIIAQHITTISTCHSNPYSIKLLFRRLLALPYGSLRESWYSFLDILLVIFQNLLSEEGHMETFLFNGKCGIEIMSSPELFREGYGFFGWLRIETTGVVHPMTIFQLVLPNEIEIELFVNLQCQLCYSMTSLKPKEAPTPINMKERALPDSKWIFVEFYHLSNNIFLYFNGDEVHNSHDKKLLTKKSFKNFIGKYWIGCRVSKIEKEGHQIIENGFRGQMSTVYFISINNAVLSPIHQLLKSNFRELPMHNLFSILAHQKCSSMSGTPESPEKILLSRIILCVNPKYAQHICEPGDKIFECPLKGGKDLLNHTKNIINNLKTSHTIPAKEVIGNLGGARCFLPFFSKLTQIDVDEHTLPLRNKLIANCLGLACFFLTSQNSLSFFEGSDLLLLRYFLEKLAQKGGFSDDIYSTTSMMQKLVGKYYPSVIEKYLENIALNVEIWRHSKHSLQQRLFGQFHYELMFQEELIQLVKVPRIFDLLLNCIEVYNIQEKNHNEFILMIVGIASSLGQRVFSGELLHICLSYANIYFVRRLTNCANLIRGVLLIFHELFHSQEESINFIKTGIKEKKESKIIVGIFSIFDYYFFQQRHRGNKSYLRKKGREQLQTDLLDPMSDEIVDEILAITIFWLLSFDFSILSEFHWKKLSEREEQKSILGFFITHYEKAAALSLWKSPLLYYIFDGYRNSKTLLFGLASYSAFISISLNVNLDILKGKQGRALEISKMLKIKSATKKQNLIKNKIIFTHIFLNIHQFNFEARNGLISDILLLDSDSRLIPELCEDLRITEVLFWKSIFSDSFVRLFLLHKKLLYYMMGESKLLPSLVRILNVFNEDSVYILEVVSGLMDNILQRPLNLTPEYKCGLLFLAQLIEEVIVKAPKLIPSQKTIQALSKFSYVLYHSGLMYVSYPVLCLFDERGDQNSDIPDILGKREALREGGFMRIMLKLLFLLCKFDTEDKGAIALLKFYIFREKEQRKKIKTMAGVTKQEGKSDKNHIKMTYNLIDLIYIDSKKIKKHKEISRAFQSGVVAEFPTLLDLKINQKTKQSSKKNIFENRAFLFNYLITQCLHIILYEYCGKSSIELCPKDTLHSSTFQEFRSKTLEFFSKTNPNVLVLVEIIKILVEKEINIQNNPKKKPPTIISEFELLLNEASARIGRYCTTPNLQLYSLHSVLNQIQKDEKNSVYYSLKEEIKDFPGEIEEKKEVSELTKDCIYSFTNFFNSLCAGLKGKKVTFSYSLIVLMNGSSFWNNFFSHLLFTSTHQFQFIDTYVWNKSCDFDNTENFDPEDQQKKFVIELKSRIRNNFSYIFVPYEKMVRDELREEFDKLASMQYHKFEKEVTSEVGIQYNKKEDIQHRTFVSYIKSRYNKVLKKCPLHNQLEKEGRIRPNSFNELVTLSLCRDSMGRAQKFKRLNLSKFSNNKVTKILFEYLRYFVLKKLMILHIMREKELKKEVIVEGFFSQDFSNSILKNLYLEYSKIPSNASTNFSPSMDSSSDSDTLSAYSTYITNSQFEEYLPRDSKVFEVEIIIPKGAVFGKLVCNKVCLSFKTEERKEGKKYCFGSTSYNRCFKKLSKKWLLKSIKEIIVKRYNLIRQAAEIYFDNSKSVFISFFSDAKLKKFLDMLKSLPGNWEIIDEPEMFFVKAKFTEQWTTNEISNFQYLILLNKYGGRTYNDIGQYPVFPWVIGDYDSTKLNLDQPNALRDLSQTIAGFTQAKRESAKEKYEILQLDPEVDAFQFGAHYLAARTVLGFLLRIEPFASHLIAFEGGMDASERMFHILSNSWNGLQKDITDNKELIPEFFYLPEMFGNYNNYSFGNRNSDNDKNAPKNSHIVRVDQAVMPPWAKDNHHFIKKNFLALECRRTSESINNWIDLVFGELQQSPDHFNCFKALVDEEYVKSRMNELDDHNITEIQEFGSIPIKLFENKHPEKDMRDFDKKNKFLIFPRDKNEEVKYSILQFKKFDSSITFIECYKNRIYVVTKAQKMYRSKEENLNVASDKIVSFEKTEIQLYPHLSLDRCKHRVRDTGRNIIFLDNGTLVLTCKHFDDSCKISSTSTGKVVKHLYHHKAMVVSICASNNGFCSGSVDGVLAKWNLSLSKLEEVSRVEWSVCDHQSSINSIDVCDEIDLVASASTDGTVSLRQLSSGKFFRLFHPPLEKANIFYNIDQIRLSPRGYLVIILSCKRMKQENSDYIQVFSINGEFIRETTFVGQVNCMIMDQLGYQFILGGSGGVALCRYSLLSLVSTFILDYIDEELPKQSKLKEQLTSINSTITALCLTPFENYQQLLIGLDTGELLSFKFSPRLTGGKIIGQ